MNKVIQTPRLCRDPEVRYTQSTNSRGEATAVARFSGAVERKFKRDGDPDADFFDYTAFGRQAEFVEKYLRKGMKVLVTGRIQNNNYTNREGQMVYGVQILVDEIEFAESRSGGNKNGQNGGQNASQAQPQPKPDGDEFMSIPDGIDDDLPFT